MGEVQGIDDLLSKIEELRVSITVNKQTLPIINDLFLFIKDIVPLMLEVNAFMKEGANKVPSATDNLSNVSKTTEMATQDVMDHLENIISELDQVKTSVLNCTAITETVKKIEAIQNEVQDVFYSFQFQDITNQQLEYVNRILNAIYLKFVYLFNSSLSLKGNTIFGQGVIDAIETELKKGELNSINEQTKDTVRKNHISQEAIDRYFK